MELAYDDVGAGPCVVLIHGHPFDRSLWQAQVVALATDFRVVAPDLRGFGESPDRPRLRQLDVPAFVCTGSDDPWSNETVTAEIVEYLQRPELVVVDGVGHLPNLEAEAVFNSALVGFLTRHAPR